MKSTAAKLSALIAVTDRDYGVWSGAPRTYTDDSNYTEGTMIACSDRSLLQGHNEAGLAGSGT